MPSTEGARCQTGSSCSALPRTSQHSALPARGGQRPCGARQRSGAAVAGSAAPERRVPRCQTGSSCSALPRAVHHVAFPANIRLGTVLTTPLHTVAVETRDAPGRRVPASGPGPVFAARCARQRVTSAAARRLPLRYSVKPGHRTREAWRTRTVEPQVDARTLPGAPLACCAPRAARALRRCAPRRRTGETEAGGRGVMTRVIAAALHRGARHRGRPPPRS